MTEPPCRWGILGTAGIARKNWQAIKHAGNGRLTAVASRSAERAAAFIAENQAEVPHDPPPRPVGSYEDLLAAEDIDALYIPLPTGLRREWVVAAAETGKHVLCEKPCGADAETVGEMVRACEAAGVQFMDGTMFVHSDRLPALRRALEEERVAGEIKRISAQFSFMGPQEFLEGNIRMHSELEPLGCLGDLGWYCIRMILWMRHYDMPLAVRARLIRGAGRPDSPDAVPLSLSGELVFDGGVTAGFYCSFEAEHQQLFDIGGTEGRVHLDDFVLPYYGPELAFHIERSFFEMDGCQFRMERHPRRVAVREYSDSHPTSQEAKMFRRFGELVAGGRPDPHWPDIALKTQRVMDACLRSARDDGAEVVP